MVRLVITGGGTGGHIYPALAIADGLKKRWPHADIHYIGAKDGMESRIVPKAGYSFWGVPAEGWQGRKIGRLTHALKTDLTGWREAAKLLSTFKPEAVIGTGGFVCLPVGLAAAQKKIPFYLHEQNAMPGLTNRLIAIWAKRIMISFAEAARRFPPFSGRKIQLTGLPVRDAIANADRDEGHAFFHLDREKKTILVAGGSQGAARINRAMLHVIKQLYGKNDMQILFATGERGYEEIAETLKADGMTWGISAEETSNVRMLPYIDRMDLAYAAADVFVGRAGASTMAEITLRGLPAILVPLPHATENHQAYNAASLVNKGGAILLEDKDLDGLTLLTSLLEILTDDSKRLAMAACSNRAANGEALEDILTILAEVMSG